MDKKVCEISHFFVALRRAFPLSVYCGFTHILIHKYLHLSRHLREKLQGGSALTKSILMPHA